MSEDSKYFQLITKALAGDYGALARLITIVENELEGFEEVLETIKPADIPVIGITGPPGAGKSTLVNSLIKQNTTKGLKTGIIAVDPTSPFNFGSLLGDRLRMAEHFNDPNVYIRSLASRGSLGGLSAKILEIIDLMKISGFDYIFVETVGVGQSEVEIAGLADTTVVVMVPESGDEVQTIKSGIMEIADIFVVNKSDRAGSDIFVKNLSALTHSKHTREWIIPVLKSVATKGEGIQELFENIKKHHQLNIQSERKPYLLAEKALKLIQNQRMKNIDKKDLLKKLQAALQKKDFNLYTFSKQYSS